MAADMSKKISAANSKASPIQGNLPKTKLYGSVRDCLQKTYEEAGTQGSLKRYLNYFRGV